MQFDLVEFCPVVGENVQCILLDQVNHLPELSIWEMALYG